MFSRFHPFGSIRLALLDCLAPVIFLAPFHKIAAMLEIRMIGFPTINIVLRNTGKFIRFLFSSNLQFCVQSVLHLFYQWAAVRLVLMSHRFVLFHRKIVNTCVEAKHCTLIVFRLLCTNRLIFHPIWTAQLKWEHDFSRLKILFFRYPRLLVHDCVRVTGYRNFCCSLLTDIFFYVCQLVNQPALPHASMQLFCIHIKTGGPSYDPPVPSFIPNMWE